MIVRANFHTHTTWCDGSDSPEAVIQAAIARNFDAIGFSSHAMLPENVLDWVLTPEKALAYAAEIRSLAAKYADRIRVFCGVEADYIPGGANPDRSTYAAISPDYIIGSVHFVAAADGAIVCVDNTPNDLMEGITAHFGGSVESYIRAYFRQVRESCDWYAEELAETADAVVASGKLVEVNTGAISRGWLDDAYPSPAFRALLRQRGARFVLSSDAHSADAINCAFDRFADSEEYVRFK